MSGPIPLPGHFSIVAASSLIKKITASSRSHYWFATAAGIQPDWIARFSTMSKLKGMELPERRFNVDGVCVNSKACAGFNVSSVVAVATAVEMDLDHKNPEIAGWVWVLVYWLRLDPDALINALKAETAGTPLGAPRSPYERFLDDCDWHKKNAR